MLILFHLLLGSVTAAAAAGKESARLIRVEPVLGESCLAGVLVEIESTKRFQLRVDRVVEPTGRKRTISYKKVLKERHPTGGISVLSFDTLKLGSAAALRVTVGSIRKGIVVAVPALPRCEDTGSVISKALAGNGNGNGGGGSGGGGSCPGVTAGSDSYTLQSGMTANLPVLLNDSTGAPPLIIESVTTPIHGSTVVAADGRSINYTSNNGSFSGPVTFKYWVRNSCGKKAQGSVTLNLYSIVPTITPTVTPTVTLTPQPTATATPPTSGGGDPLAPLTRAMTQSDIFHLYKRAAFGFVPEEELQRGLTSGKVEELVRNLFVRQDDRSAELRALEIKDAIKHQGDTGYRGCCESYNPLTNEPVTPSLSVPPFVQPPFGTSSEGVGLYAIVRMTESPNPAHEFMVFRFLHNLIPVSSTVVDRDHADRNTMIWMTGFPGDEVRPGYFNVLRKLLDEPNYRYPDLLKEITRHPAMLKYLNGDSNTKAQPNQNYGRELMELFTLGTHDRAGSPNYTDADIAAASRALTGMQITETTQSGWYQNPYRRYTVAAQGPSNPNFETTPQSLFAEVLGAAQPGVCRSVVGADQLIDCIFHHPQAARFLADQIGRHYLRDDVGTAYPHLIEAMANDLRANGFDLVATIQKLLKSEIFYRSENRNRLLRSAMERAIHIQRALYGTGMRTWTPGCSFGESFCLELNGGMYGYPGGMIVQGSNGPSRAEVSPVSPIKILRMLQLWKNVPGDPPNVFGWRNHADHFTSSTGYLGFSRILAQVWGGQGTEASWVAQYLWSPGNLVAAPPAVQLMPPLNIAGSINYNQHRDATIRHVARLLSIDVDHLNEGQLMTLQLLMDSTPFSNTSNYASGFSCLETAAAAVADGDGVEPTSGWEWGRTTCASCGNGVQCGENNTPWNPFVWSHRRNKLIGLFMLLSGTTEFNT